jgi:hypothetical protein
MTYYQSLTGAGAFPTAGTGAESASVPVENTFTVASPHTSTKSAAGFTVQTSSTSSTKGTVSTHTAASGSQSTPVTQKGGASDGHSRGSGLYALAILAAGQLLM